MITLEAVLLEFRELPPARLLHWVDNRWVRPSGAPGALEFTEIDVARIRLILDLRDILEVDEPALPTVLGLLDQLYEMRRHVRRLHHAIGDAPEAVQLLLWERLDRDDI